MYDLVICLAVVGLIVASAIQASSHISSRYPKNER